MKKGATFIGAKLSGIGTIKAAKGLGFQEKTRSWLEKLRSAEAQLASQLTNYDRAKTTLEDYLAQFAPQRLADLGISEPELLLRAQGGIFHRQQPRKFDESIRVFKAI